jgi:hypothetical protein
MSKELTGLESCWECIHYQEEDFEKCPCLNLQYFKRKEVEGE